MRPVGGEDKPALDAIRTTTVDHRLGRVLVVVDEPVPEERHAGRGQERPDDLAADVTRNPRPRKAASKGQGDRQGRAQMSAGERSAARNGEGDGDAPETTPTH